jgi:hypothetical protein
MKLPFGLGIWGRAILLGWIGAGVGCQQPPAPAPPPVIQQENGRFQLVVSGGGEGGAVLFLLDTREGGTWIYRPPQPPAFNGFWSDIPRLTYPPETWQQVFSMMIQQAQQAQQAQQQAPTQPPAGGLNRVTPPTPTVPGAAPR